MKTGSVNKGPRKLLGRHIDIKVHGFSKNSRRIEYVEESKPPNRGGQPVGPPEKRLSRKCPYCREEIPIDALKCRYCGSMLMERRPSSRGTTFGDGFRLGFGFRLGWMAVGYLWAVVIILILVILFIIVGKFLSGYYRW
jgi:hypothetical protein